ncbi:BMP family ABC transporter substrate-binding protein [Flavonifractor plautii]|uniref:Purine nucleoside receptor A n=1 Tax=Flavonifractor plautii TaxID=292800 RepID=A0A173ZTX9_FLAPL|nr:BMP family ABC transporter substrate-binding protein [Flavonifractor plautii]MDB7879154.1 BMP family ABC transporter substrate-binding protein [Flavonifractor plautii]MDB7900219.1 BMP family ABC transporter substrate-binding protein [Flavonifractor plautii]MDB7920899.1 BMP family ABC transporter substrate-binding protein [Flavonifractor plautii]MDB7942817.1 BMP family ABC transporter substrate-binding protein [Flavonifractor plautii]MDS9666204.1 BMP family ABC transporter substrate-binding 
MKKSKKLLALLLCLAMVFGLAACGNSNKPADSQTPAPGTNTETPAPETETPGETEADPDAIEDSMTSADGKYQVAFVTDVGQLKDKSFNQGTFDGVKLYAAANGLSYKYYQPANGSEATDDDRYDAMKAAVEGGADVVVCAGYLQEAALRKAAIEYPDTPFVFIDGYPIQEQATEYDAAGNALPNDSPVLTNVAGVAFQEQQAGYLAGYAAVKDGFTKLGFSGGGGGTNPACCRFGYGYVQGANAAALEKGITVDMNYSWQYGSNFSASTDLQTMINGWYVNGTEIVFACGGSMFQSIVAAASANDGYVIGVDVDQSGESEYVVTSAMKGLADAVQWAVAKVYDGTFDTIGGQQTSLGVADNAVQLPTGADSWRFETFTVEEYESLYQQMVDGTLVVDDDYTVMDNAETATNWSNVNVNII